MKNKEIKYQSQSQSKKQSTSHVKRETSSVSCHMPFISRHTSHVTRHTSHVTRHTSPAKPTTRFVIAAAPRHQLHCRDITAKEGQEVQRRVWTWISCEEKEHATQHVTRFHLLPPLAAVDVFMSLSRLDLQKNAGESCVARNASRDTRCASAHLNAAGMAFSTAGGGAGPLAPP